MKVALVHEHLAQDGGAERVLRVLAEMFPEAPIYTLLYKQKHADRYFKDRHIETSIIQKLPWGVKRYRWYMPFMPMAVEFFDLTNYDVIISSSSAFAKGVITQTDSLHICYCHTPTRYLWSDTHKYINELKYNKFFKKIISLMLNRIRVWDKVAADRVDKFIANSTVVKHRISKYYRRSSEVIYPPVDTHKFRIANKLGDYFLVGCRLVSYKRVDLVIETFKELGPNFKLKIFGDGVDEKRLRKIAGDSVNIEFLGRVSDEEKAELYSHSLAFLNPQEEDFGITTIEAMAAGRPVIAYARGGATETVIEGKTGTFFHEQTVKSLGDVIRKFDRNRYNPQEIKNYSDKFSVANFKEAITSFINKNYRHEDRN